MNDDGSSMLSFLFEGQDSQNRMGFGSGGLLGLRGIAAKLPSFRVSLGFHEIFVFVFGAI